MVLSACETAVAGDRADVAQGLAGVAAQGARSVIGSLWKVPDEAAAMFMSAFYESWTQAKRTSVASALAQAQDRVRQRYPHPTYWAPFINMGRWD